MKTKIMLALVLCLSLLLTACSGGAPEATQPPVSSQNNASDNVPVVEEATEAVVETTPEPTIAPFLDEGKVLLDNEYITITLESEVEEFIRKGKNVDVPQEDLTVKDRMQYAWEQVVSTAKKVAPYVLIGVGIGAFIHNWIPEEFIIKLLGTGNPLGVVIATIAGVPMYADIFGTIPIAEALLARVDGRILQAQIYHIAINTGIFCRNQNILITLIL